MSSIKILDCTLRDGGYVNNWMFGERGIKKIISKLSQANIDIIECGFLTYKGGNKDTTLFKDVSKVKDYIIDKKDNIMYVGMIAYPNSVISNIPVYDGKSIDGIRVTFHESEIEEALEVCKDLMYKGYKVFVQPICVASYDDLNLINLINKVNDIKPYAFYIVDTLGSLYKNNLLRMYYLIDNNLNKDIHIGFHSHNNLQLSFSNAQELMMLQTKRTIIIDSSVFGMGRGSGNLCTELLAQYINVSLVERYNIEYLLEIIDEHLNNIYAKYSWGYSAPYCLAAINNCHPNYATYLMDKQTITIKSISTILKNMHAEKRVVYDKGYIEQVYMEYQKKYIDDNDDLEKLKNTINGKKVLILAPGKSLEVNRNLINDIIDNDNLFVISINFIPKAINSDYVFISNQKRFDELADIIKIAERANLILTSNITANLNNIYSIVNYSDLLIDNQLISDNAGLMLINLLNRLSVHEIYLAGFDGYAINKNNYLESDMELVKTNKNIIEMNKAVRESIQRLRLTLDIRFITKSKYN